MSGLIPGSAPLFGGNGGATAESALEAILLSIIAAGGKAWWLRADSGITAESGKVSVWASRIAGGKSVAQVTPAKRPTIVTGEPTIVNPNGCTYLDCGIGNVQSTLAVADSELSALAEAEAFFVFRQVEAPTNANGYGGLHHLSAATVPGSFPSPGSDLGQDNFGISSRLGVGVPALQTIQCVNSTSAPNSSTTRRNGVLVRNTAGTSVAFGATSQTLLGDPGYATSYHKGPFFEFIMTSRLLTTAERAIAQTYLTWRNSVTFA